jgi:oxalate decarboxylase/phosphoglucose isomerase-like protein (cupin superfamily)
MTHTTIEPKPNDTILLKCLSTAKEYPATRETVLMNSPYGGSITITYGAGHHLHLNRQTDGTWQDEDCIYDSYSVEITKSA